MITPITITVTKGPNGPYKSIGDLQWAEIPGFAVLTGLNGSGKTQFLQLLGYKLSGAFLQSHTALNGFNVQIAGDTITAADVAYLPSGESHFQARGASISDLVNIKQQYLQQLSPQNTQQNVEKTIQRAVIERKYGIRLSNQVTQADLAKLPDDFLFMLEYGDVSSGLGHVIYGYQVRHAELLLQKKTDEEILQILGPSPWKLVNDALRTADFNYRLSPPSARLLEPYVPTLTENGKEIRLGLNDLSSGEKAIFRTILWFYNSKQNNIFPKLVLMDEPDAHLHPSMTRQFIEVIKDVLVEQYGVRVILTTHSPSTVALAPQESIFVMSRSEPRIQRAASKSEAIGLLTSGLVIVSPGTRFIFVEDSADVQFYSGVRDVLSDQGPSRDSKALKPAPSLVFLPASIGKGGGKNAVEQWVSKLSAPPLDEMMRGIIDMDEGNVGSARVKVLSRYSIENYQLDPLVVFGLLIDEGRAPTLPNIAISKGDEHLLRGLGSATLQSIVDYIASVIEPKLGVLQPADLAKAETTFTNGVSLNYPHWLLSKRGHDLLPIYQAVFGQAVITPPKLDKAWRRVRLVPVELANVMHELQNGN